MSSIATLTLNDGATTPVAHSFAPVNIDKNGVAWFADRSGGIALGYPTISYFMRSPTKESRVYKLTTKVVTPILEVTSPSTSSGIQPAPTKAYDIIFNIEAVLPERSTLQERKNAFAYAKNLLAHAALTAGVESFESVY
jgi:hypothetical protein